MKSLLLLLCLLSTPAFAADTVVGFLKSNGPDAEPSLVLENGAEIELGLHFQGGSACGAFRAHFREILAATGHEVRLTGLVRGSEFLVDLGGIEILR